MDWRIVPGVGWTALSTLRRMARFGAVRAFLSLSERSTGIGGSDHAFLA